MLLLFLILFSELLCNSMFFVQNLYTNFRFAPTIEGSVCSSDNYTECFEMLCNSMNQTNPHIAYIAFVPFATMLNCTTMPSYKNTSMIVFGLNMKDKPIIIVPTKCDTVGDCFMKGCEIYNNYYTVYWILFTGQCY